MEALRLKILGILKPIIKEIKVKLKISVKEDI